MPLAFAFPNIPPQTQGDPNGSPEVRFVNAQSANETAHGAINSHGARSGTIMDGSFDADPMPHDEIRTSVPTEVVVMGQLNVNEYDFEPTGPRAQAGNVRANTLRPTQGAVIRPMDEVDTYDRFYTRIRRNSPEFNWDSGTEVGP
jgi:hypothetical protein